MKARLTLFTLFVLIVGSVSAQENCSPYPGDFDGDFDVDFADFIAFARVFGSTYSPPLSDRDRLIALYLATNGDNWRVKANWLTDSDISAWHGIVVSNNRVVTINLQGNNLTGTIPKELGGLDKLQVLYLHKNQLTGPIPPELAKLPDLRVLFLSENQLTRIIHKNR